MDTATIFYNDERWLAGETKCFDYRLKAASLPAGSVVCGFILCDASHWIEAVRRPYCSSVEQATEFDRVLASARTALAEGR